MLTAHALTPSPGLLGRLFDGIARLSANLDLAHELKGLNSDQARVLLERRGQITGPNWQLPEAARIQVRLLSRLMRSLGLDPDAVSRAAPQTMRGLQRACASCGERSRCEHEHELGQAHATYHSFCPNAPTLDRLRAEGAGAA
jgi:hypothetical protein